MTFEQGEFPGTGAIAIVGGEVRAGALGTVLRSPLYRGAAISLFIAGIAASAAAPLMSRYFVDDLHASLAVAGLFYLTNLTAPIAGFLIGRWSDRTGRRLVFFRWCAVLGGLGWLGIALSTAAWEPFLVTLVVLAIAGISGSQLFAAVHDELQATHEPAGDGVVSVVRMALTAGWVIGPLLGALLVSVASFREIFLGTAALTVLQILPMGTLRTSAGARVMAAADGAELERERRVRLPRSALWPLLAFSGLYVLVFTTDPIRYAYLPILMSDRFHVSAGVSGVVMGVQPLVELILMPVMMLVARRVGTLRLMSAGAALGVAANVCFALSGGWGDGWLGFLIGQLLIGVMYGVFAALGIIVAQRLLPGAIATASAVFMSAPAVTAALGGLTGGLGAQFLGLPQVFWLPAGYGVVAVVGLWALSRSRLGRAA